MPFQFKRAKREGVVLAVCFVGPTGSGKTYSALELASGICGDKPFAVIATENGRAKHYADQFLFDLCDLEPPFDPNRYVEALRAADAAGYGAIIVDSGSHSHMGQGGILEMHDAAWGKLGRKESTKMLAWAKPKQANRNMIQAMLRTKAHVIMCLRAEHKVKVTTNDKGQMVVGDARWVPICEKHLTYEMTCSLLFSAESPGVPIPIKLEEQHRHLFPGDRPVTREVGRALSGWARGASASENTGQLADVLGQIAGAATLDELKTLNASIGWSGFSQYECTVIKRGFGERHEKLSAG